MSAVRTVFVTGATAGFGQAIAEKFAHQGWQVVALGRRRERLEELKEKLPTPVHTICCDVTNQAALMAEVASLPKKFRQIDVLVNNAGLALGLAPAHQAKLEHWDTMISTNITALVHLTHHLLPAMVEKGCGHVVNVGSIAGSYPYPGGNVYGATKAFVKQFSLNLRADLAGTGVRVTNIEPGLAQTEFSTVRFEGDQQKADSVYEGTKPLTGADIAEAVWWATTQPLHVNINRIEVMPTCQSSGPLAVTKQA